MTVCGAKPPAHSLLYFRGEKNLLAESKFVCESSPTFGSVGFATWEFQLEFAHGAALNEGLKIC